VLIQERLLCPAGLIARLCNTLVVAASMAAVSESLAVGKRLGVDSKVLTQVSRGRVLAGLLRGGLG
jgi:3-hydroxyisobutyrate dehydrogenase-like beta-hydroxyacid dehydrogenase